MQTIERSYSLRNPIEAAAIIGFKTPAYYVAVLCFCFLYAAATHAQPSLTTTVTFGFAVTVILFAFTTSVVLRMSKMRAVYTIQEMQAAAPPHVATILLHAIAQTQNKRLSTVALPKVEMQEVLTYIQSLREIAGMKQALRKGQADEHTQVVSAPK